ncbi:MAG: SufD family Fe-S cluster assembly protein [Candidatus Alcyoniella australis]|nr:SufD family Fe-S cluster assembly protein [Candidatus Alcyoniella australis]
MSEQTIERIYQSIDYQRHDDLAEDAAYVVVHGNEVLGSKMVPGLEIKAEQLDQGVEIWMRVHEGTQIEKPVHMCFGLMPETGVQRIVMHVNIEDRAQVAVLAHCTFPNAKQIEHLMDAEISVGRNASYSYLERHVHGDSGGTRVVPKAKVTLHEGARFKTEFELVKGRVGELDIEYETTCHARSVMEMTARIKGFGHDRIRLNEIGHLVGEDARGVLTSHIAVRDNARAEIRNTLTATAAGCRGHVDCKEIVMDHAVAMAVPVVEVRHPKAHVTHEAAIGSVDSKQLETLMARGLNEDDAADLIIDGLLKRP